MKTLIALAVLVMAAGCTQSNYERMRQTARSVPTLQEWNAMHRKPQQYYAPASNSAGPATIVFNEAPQPQPAPAPQPVVVVGPGSPAVTGINRIGNSTLISSFGFQPTRPSVAPYPYYGY